MNKILMVDEEVSTVQKVHERLSIAGFEMFFAYDGFQGFQIAKDKLPDLIIADALIPVLSGFELCKAIKRDEDIKTIPIVVMTEKHCMEESFMFLGVRDFLNKPICMDELEILVRNKLDLSQMMHLQRTKILINGRPETLRCCMELFKGEPSWTGYYSYNDESFLRNAIKYAPDVILMDLLMPGIPPDEMIKKMKLVPELKNTIILTYYTGMSAKNDPLSLQVQTIEVRYMKDISQDAGAIEYLGSFNPVTFLDLINVYRKDFEA